jgi:hypothetical protein
MTAIGGQLDSPMRLLSVEDLIFLALLSFHKSADHNRFG